MKKIFLIISVVLLSIVNVYAQKTISKPEFDHFIDFANCKYVEAYVSTLGDNSAIKDKVLEGLKGVTISDNASVLSYDDLKKLCGSENSVVKLIDKIHGRKNEFNQSPNDNKLLMELKASSWEKIDLTSTSTLVLCEVQNYLQASEMSKLSLLNDNLKNEVSSIAKQLSNLQLLLNVFAVIFLIIIIIVVGYTYIVNRRNNNKFATKEELEESSRLSKTDNNDISEEIADSAKLNTEEQKKQNINSSAEITKQPEDVKYLKNQTGNIFKRAVNDPNNSFYKLYGENNGEASFDFCGNIDEALGKNVFEQNGICDVTKSCQDPKTVKNTKPGKVRRTDDAGWEVIEKIQIELS